MAVVRLLGVEFAPLPALKLWRHLSDFFQLLTRACIWAIALTTLSGAHNAIFVFRKSLLFLVRFYNWLIGVAIAPLGLWRTATLRPHPKSLSQSWERDFERFFSLSPNMATQYTPVAYAVFQRCSPPKSPNSGGLQL